MKPLSTTSPKLLYHLRLRLSVNNYSYRTDQVCAPDLGRLPAGFTKDDDIV